MAESTCRVDGCERPVTRPRSGLCELHYQRRRRHGDTLGVGRLSSAGWFPKQPVVERFWRYVTRGSEDACWEWTGGRVRGQYGRFWTGERESKAHRFSYELHVGPIPEGLQVCHSCDNPPCVNPAHLWVGTNDDNMADKKAKDRNPRGDDNGSRRFIERMPRGEDHPSATVSDVQVAEVLRLYHFGSLTQTALAQRFGVSQGTISNIVLRKGRFADASSVRGVDVQERGRRSPDDDSTSPSGGR